MADEHPLDAIARAVGAQYGPVDTSLAIEAEHVVYALTTDSVLAAVGDVSGTNALEARQRLEAMGRLFVAAQAEAARLRAFVERVAAIDYAAIGSSSEADTVLGGVIDDARAALAADGGTKR